MVGFIIALLTEYATGASRVHSWGAPQRHQCAKPHVCPSTLRSGVDVPSQIEMLLSYLSVVDVE